MNKHPEFLLNKIENPKDLKKLDLKELEQLASEIRTLILEKMLQKVATLVLTLELSKLQLPIIMFLMHQRTRLFGTFLTKLIHIRC